MATATSQDVVLRGIRPDDIVSGLSLGHAAFTPLKTFLRDCAHRYQGECLAKTYVYATQLGARVVAYITVLCSLIEIDGGQPEIENYPYPDLPAVKIARLAVDRRYRGQDLGTKLVSVALALAKERVQPHVGCRFVVVDAKRQSVGFYEKLGFRLLDTPNNRARSAPAMFIDLLKI